MNRRALKIKKALKANDFTQKNISVDLCITTGAVAHFVSGKSSSARFDQWIIDNLGQQFYDSLKKSN